MELNKDQIIKELKIWLNNFDGQVLNFYTLSKAFALIEELDKDNKWSAKRIIEADKMVLQLNAENEQLKKAKQDVAREIFGEIVEIADQLMNSPYYSIGDAVHDLAELKKKYIGEGK